MPEERTEDGEVTAPREQGGTITAWLVVAFLVAAMFLRVFVAIRTVGSRPQVYSYRSAPLIPAEAPSSTQPASTSTENVPAQVELPPPAVGKQAARSGRDAGERQRGSQRPSDGARGGG